MKTTKIKISVQNAAAIEAALAGVNGRAAAHTFVAAEQVIRCAERAEAMLAALGLPAGARSGATSASVSGDALSRAYKYTRTITSITLTRGGTAWFLTDAAATVTWSREGSTTDVCLTESQAAHVTSKFHAGFRVSPAIAAPTSC